jgi:hypothetical protein
MIQMIFVKTLLKVLFFSTPLPRTFVLFNSSGQTAIEQVIKM